MTYLILFWTFFKIGITTFGGGYAMIPVLQSEILANGWMTEAEILNFIAIAESTPGPIAINMATFVGSSQAGFFGAVCATFGVVLPSFAVILLIVGVVKGLMEMGGVKGFLTGVRPVVVALISFTAVTMFLSIVLGFTSYGNAINFDWKALVILAIVILLSIVYKLIFKKKISPILLIVISAGLGMLFYGLIG